jgi:hypothetical protein
MNRARPTLITTAVLIAVCCLSLLFFVGLDTFLHVKIPYAVVTSFFLIAVVIFGISKLAFRRGEVPANAATDSRAAGFQEESHPESGGLPVNSVAMVIARPFDGSGRRDGAAPERTVAPRVSLHGVILFSNSPGTNSGKEAV